ncbi:hypothetical protein IJ798_00190 [Candidatus Saccharibacteria bacterium]|nr:hypothetical protein [Candidatus Saccharibacteria bacterium]
MKKPSSTYTGNTNPNPGNAFTVTLKAKWESSCSIAVGKIYNFDYTGAEQTFTAPCNGYYKLEVWGASGGTAKYSNYSGSGGYGGYSQGVIQINGDSLYINIGGNPGDINSMNTASFGGYNGGGDSTTRGDLTTAAGGGSTHIATKSGVLSTLSSSKDSILIVAGGGGGGSYVPSWADRDRKGVGGNGGGISGNNGSYYLRSGSVSCEYFGQGGTQFDSLGVTSDVRSAYYDTVMARHTDTAGGFGYGGKGFYASQPGGSGAGGGWYGGGGCACNGGGGGGSGYIGSSNLISGGGVTKHMTCYSCTTSSAAATRTYSNTTTPTSTPTADVARIGNGYARITYLGTSL